MKKPIFCITLALSAWLCSNAASAQTAQTWFTVMGDPSDPSVNTIQVNPTPVSVDGEQRTMLVRVSRSTMRRNWDGLPYRSYESRVRFDCVNNSARYLSADFYMQPAWTGERVPAAYSAETPRMMEFRDVTPNPTLRIMRAACSVGRSPEK